MSRQLPSSAERLFQALKSELTLGLFLRNGSFWTAIESVRSKWNIQASIRVPAAEDSLWPRIIDYLGSAPETSALHQIMLAYWGSELFALHDASVPKELQRGDRRLSQTLWMRFFSNSVLNDPPESQLIEFAATGSSMAVSYSLVDPRDFDLSNLSLSKSPREHKWMVGAPLVHRPHHDAVIKVEQWLREQLLAELGRRYLSPLGIDIWAAVEAILRETSLKQEYREKYASLPLQSMITVEADTTKEEVLSAFRLIKATQTDRPPVGRRPVDDLTAVQCAIWAENGMTHKEIAQRLDLSLQLDDHGSPYRSDQVRYRIKRGRAILAGRKNPTE